MSYAPGIALSRQSEDRVGPSVDSPTNHLAEVDAEKRKPGVRNKGNRAIDFIAGFVRKLKLLTPERDNSQWWLEAGH